MSSVRTKLANKSIETDNLYSLTAGMVLELFTVTMEDLLLNQVTNKVKNKKTVYHRMVTAGFPGIEADILDGKKICGRKMN